MSKQLSRARFGVFGTFLTAGFTAGAWAASLPALDRRLELGEARLGTALLVIAGCALVSALVTGRLCDRHSSRTVLLFAGPLNALTLLGPTFAESYPALLASAALFGLSLGMIEVSMNVNSVGLETAYERPILSAFHGFWSLGGALAGGATAVAVAAGIGSQSILLAAITISTVAHLAFNRMTTNEDRSPVRARGKSGSVTTLGLGVVVLVAFLSFAAHFSEGAVFDWANIFAVRALGAEDALAPLSFAVFATAMTVVRFVGDPLRAAFGPRGMLLLNGTLAVSGYAIALSSPWTGGLPVALCGWLVTGFGLATTVPVLFGAVGAAGGSGRDLSIISTFGGFGLLLGPAVIGYVAEASNMVFALIVPGLLTAALLIAGPLALRRLEQQEMASAEDGMSRTGKGVRATSTLL
jgi:MFS family permease